MKKTLLIATALVALGGVTAFATVAMAEGRGQMRGGPDFATLDANGDGALTADDIQAASDARFAELDTDGDGSISEAEYVARAAALASERAAQAFARLDADEDGSLSRDVLEARAGRASGMAARMIERQSRGPRDVLGFADGSVPVCIQL
ncbi:MAG: EF-hand domain-containing protein, partial [Pseudomonadota bacterium]